jgi:hypothetical protein
MNLYNKLHCLSTLIAGIFSISVQGQHLSLQPLENNPAIIEAQRVSLDVASRNNNVCPVDTLSLPFFDDFSADYSIYPSCSLWQDNHVFVNFDMASNPPSVGVATFDGLSSDGNPYDVYAAVSAGSPADTLSSQHLDLLGKSINDQIYLSFYYQKQGLSDRPEERDSLILEFKDSSDTWNLVWSLPGVADSVSTLSVPAFQQQYILIDSGAYFYQGFQFRFRNLASISGNNDHWHLDYIYLDENRANNADSLNPNYGRYSDVAFTHRPKTPLKNGYTAMPWKHFDTSDSWKDSLQISNFNHNDLSGVATLDRLYEVEEIAPNSSTLLTEAIPAVASYVPSPNSDDKAAYFINSTFSTTFEPIQKTRLKSSFTILAPTGFQNNPIFFDNDTVCTFTDLDNYFAYDDGTAETRVIAQGLGTKVAVEFVAEVKDTLQGIYFHLPYFTNRDAQLDFINVKVWLDSLSGQEAFSRDLYHLQYANGFNGFFFVELLDFSGEKVLIHLEPGQKFYVGWQQSFGPEVPVGFDRSTDARSKTFVGTGTNWDTMSLVGSVMIRPLLWGDSNFTLIPIEKVDSPKPQVILYPNPVVHNLQLQLTDVVYPEAYQLRIVDAIGRVLYQQAYATTVATESYPSGIYFVTILSPDGQLVDQQKFIKQ